MSEKISKNIVKRNIIENNIKIVEASGAIVILAKEQIRKIEKDLLRTTNELAALL
jgi:hypothetical protein